VSDVCAFKVARQTACPELPRTDNESGLRAKPSNDN
jgi:hypothetical protein